MKNIQLSNTGLEVSNIVMGCMHLNELSKKEAGELVNTAIERGINFFDHADIYGNGECESLFAEAVNVSSIRQKVFIQSKCGIVKRTGFAYFDFSKEHILTATEGILKRLKTDYLDVLLLHRPDTLVEPNEVAAAFDSLQQSGKVRHFGISNQNPSQIELLQSGVSQKLVANQLQLSIAHCPMIDSGLTVNMNIDQSISRENGILEYCRLKNITIQAWSPFQKGFFEGVFLGDATYARLNEVINRIAAKYGVSPEAIAVAWITRHPANMQVVLGTTKQARIIASAQGSDLALSHEEWYEIYSASGKKIP